MSLVMEVQVHVFAYSPGRRFLILESQKSNKIHPTLCSCTKIDPMRLLIITNLIFFCGNQFNLLGTSS